MVSMNQQSIHPSCRDKKQKNEERPAGEGVGIMIMIIMMDGVIRDGTHVMKRDEGGFEDRPASQKEK